MDPERVRGYLQVACAGLGFDIGEIWWTQNETGTSTLATIGELLPPFSSEVSLAATCHDTAFTYGSFDPRHHLLWELVTHCSLRRPFRFVTAMAP